MVLSAQRIQDSLALCDLEAKLALDDEVGDADDETDPVTVSSRNRRSPRPITSLSVRAKRKEKWALVATDLPVIGSSPSFLCVCARAHYWLTV